MTLEEFVSRQNTLIELYMGAYQRDHERQPRNYPSNMTFDQWLVDFECWIDLNEEIIHGYLEYERENNNSGTGRGGVDPSSETSGESET